jgi:hypothetical protein
MTLMFAPAGAAVALAVAEMLAVSIPNIPAMSVATGLARAHPLESPRRLFDHEIRLGRIDRAGYCGARLRVVREAIEFQSGRTGKGPPHQQISGTAFARS